MKLEVLVVTVVVMVGLAVVVVATPIITTVQVVVAVIVVVRVEPGTVNTAVVVAVPSTMARIKLILLELKPATARSKSHIKLICYLHATFSLKYDKYKDRSDCFGLFYFKELTSRC
ncbi:MAG: hypothetical protein K8S87_04325 [Planctomycetes bacterium]|nr:hypothetical protein [Planctomycetota bacterium]